MIEVHRAEPPTPADPEMVLISRDALTSIIKQHQALLDHMNTTTMSVFITTINAAILVMRSALETE